MTWNEVINIDEAIAHVKQVAKEKDTLARTFRGFRDYGNPKSTITSGAEECQRCSEEYEQLAKWLEEYKQYHAIGTVEEFKALKEKNEPKKIVVWADETEHCPNEDCHYSEFPLPYGDKFNFCPECGQALNWSEGE